MLIGSKFISMQSSTTSDFGSQRISLFQSICLLLNNITGAAMVLYPTLFQAAGWLLPLVTMLFAACLSAVAGLCLLKCMQLIPNNEHFQQRYEFTSIARHFCSDSQYKTIFFFFICSMFTGVIPLIIQSSQVMDFVLVELFGKSCGIAFYPFSRFGWICQNEAHDSTPFGSEAAVFSAGIIFLALICIPIGFWNLDENAHIQVGAAFSMIAIFICWSIYWVRTGLDFSRVPVIGTDVSKVLGIVVFNYTFVVTLPSWVNEKHPETPIPRAVVCALVGATALFVTLGLLGAAAYAPFFNSHQDVLDRLNQSGDPFARITYFLFPLIVNLTSIPIVSIIIRYNLTSNHVCSKGWSNFIAVILPWLLSIPLYSGSGFLEIVTWAGVLVSGAVNFLIPLYLYVLAVRKYGGGAEEVDHYSTQPYYSLYAVNAVTGEELETSSFAASESLVGCNEFVDPIAAASNLALEPHHQACTCVPRTWRMDRTRLAYLLMALFILIISTVFAIDVFSLSKGASI